MGFYGWCVSLGLLNELQPVAGIVFAPKLELLLFADVGERATLNGSELFLPDLPDPLSAKSNIMVPSNIHKELDLSEFPEKIRNIGSAALHLCFPALYPGVFGTVESHRVHIWDIVGAHAIIRSQGFDFEYLDGGHIDYSTMTDGRSVGGAILCGSSQRIHELKSSLRRAVRCVRGKSAFRRNAIVKLRPHHLIDIVRNYGHGVQFEPHPYGHALHHVAEQVVSNPDLVVEFVLAADEVCYPCRHLRADGRCEDVLHQLETPTSKQTYNDALDAKLFSYFKMQPGTCMTVGEFLEQLDAHMPGIEKLCTHPGETETYRLDGLQQGLVRLGVRQNRYRLEVRE